MGSKLGLLTGLVVGLFVLAPQVSAYCWQTGDATGPIYNASCGETKCNNTGPNGNAKGTAYYDYALYCAEEDVKGECTRWDDGCYYHTFECNEPCEGANYDGGGACPAECRQGSSCGVGYSSASGCKSNQVCFEAMIKSSHWSHDGRQN
jgi:hypothetical protein